MNKEELYKRKEKLEERKIAYLEVNNKANVRRISKEIEVIETQIKLLDFNKLKEKLLIYKSITRNYPGVSLEIKRALEENNLI